jgi:uncharacterized protein (TIGR02996 family)
MSTSEEGFLRAIAEQPYEVAHRLVYADWLEERGDPKAEKVRAQCRYRLPITSEETRHLAAIAAARDEAHASQVRIAVNPARPGYRLVAGPGGTDALADDLVHLSPVEIARNFPREDRGRFQLDCVVLLARYRCTDDLARLHELWLAATGPARRSDPQVITVGLEPLIGENHPHNWSGVRWWWDERAVSRTDQARWGITGEALREITGPAREKTVANLKARWQGGTITDAERIALCTAFQDEGRFEDALGVCEVEYPEEVSRLLNGEMFHLPGGGDWPAPKAMEARPGKVRRVLWEAAPWRFAQGLADARARMDAWKQERAGRTVTEPQLRLFIFPGSKQARKAGLMLVPGPGGGPQLAIRFTGSNVVLPETTWKRPVELDIARCCGGTESEAPARRKDQARGRPKSKS